MNFSKSSYRLSLIILILASVTSAGGLLLKDLYRDPQMIKSAWFGNDVITLFIVIPALGISMLKSKTGSIEAYLVWMGLLVYMIYNYAFYLFGAAFNKFFLIYVSIFSLSIYALILGLLTINLEDINRKFLKSKLGKWTAIFLLFVSIPLALVEIGMCIDFLKTAKLPPAPPLIFALDLSLVVPTSALAAILLWRRKPWGYPLTILMLVKALTYGSGLSISTIYVGMQGTLDPLLPFYIFITLGGGLFLILLLKKQHCIITNV